MLRRTRRTVYRVYTQEEFAGAGMLTDWDVAPATEASRERRMRRLAGVAALTGALGTVGVAIAVARVGSRPAEVPVTVRGAPRVPAARPPAGSEISARAINGRSPAGNRALVARRGGFIAQTRSASRRVRGGRVPAATSVRTRRALPVKSEAAQRDAASVTAPAPSSPGESAARPPRQTEFGFER